MLPDTEKEGKRMTGEEIVISGISGKFPNTKNTQKLIYNLYNKVDMVNEINYIGIKHPELPTYFGQIDGLEKFDAQFFRVTKGQAVSFDPLARKIMEESYSAIFDAGINPETLKGSKLGVFVGSSLSDSATVNLYEVFKTNGFVISGCSKTMIANRVSYWIDGKGPSYSLDYACASSMACLEMAYQRLKAGDCDTALVGGCIHSMNPVLTLNMKRAGLLCSDGKTKCFDKNGDGFVRSDAINMLFLQKAKDAKRIYTEVYHVKGKYFSKPDATFLPTRDSEDIARFFGEFYEEVDVSPNAVEFIEANATGISEADGNELDAVGRFFGEEKPIKVGSIKSNMGHTQPVSGACSLTKICLAYQRGEIPANLHFNEPQNHITAVKEGKVKVVKENTPFNRSFTAINNFSITGANFHVLLKGHFKPKNNALYKSSIPRLVLASGRKDESVHNISNILEGSPVDYEQIALLNNIFKYNIPGHTGRGYTIIDTDSKINQTVSLARGFEYYSGIARPVWFLYSGMGSQWVTMGSELMRIPIFSAAIERCDKVLKAKGLDIISIITENDSGIFDNILNSFVGITAVQIGLTDVLKSMDLLPDKIIGHSLGEIACAYADCCFTTEEAILVSYFRGIASIETKLIKGKMAAIGLGHNTVRDLCPPEIDIACRNSSESTTISGPKEDIEKFVAYLTSRSIFAKTVASNNIAFHSRYIADAGPILLAKMKEVLKDPKTRSKKWLSTCFLPENWTNARCKHASPEYFTHNILNTVYFEETAKFIPDNAIVIEIAPHGLMQAIIKRSHVNCINVPLTRRNEKDNVLFMLKAIGTLYQAGLNPDVDAIYPIIDFPVSTETPVLSHFVEWEHSNVWSYKKHDSLKEKITTLSYEFNMSIHDDDYSFIKGHIRNGINVFPETALLVIVWETVAMFKNTDYRNLSIVFNNVKFQDQIKIVSEKRLKLQVDIQRASNKFEITHDKTLIASGSIDFELKNNKRNYTKILLNDNEHHLNATDIYKVLSSRGYSYEGEFQSMQATNIKRNKALLKWDRNWITFLDSLIQFNAISKDYDGVSSIKHINKLLINLKEHENLETVFKYNTICHSAQIFKDIKVSKCGGVTLKNIAFTDIPKPELTASRVQIKEKLGKLYIPVNVKTKTQNLKLINDTYTWVENMDFSLNNAIQIIFTSASTSDFNLEKNPNINKYGTDFSGIDARGNRVMGFTSNSSISSFVEASPEFLWPVPQHWSLEEAATVPLPYIHALYCLNIRSNLHKRDTIFVSNGDSGFGQAVISVCLGYDCTVFTTVSNIEKKKFIKRLFPKLDEHKIGYSNDVYFKYMVINATKGKRCDIVIDGSRGAIRQAATGCVGLQSTYLDINEYGMEDNEDFGMEFLKEARSYKAICFTDIFLKDNSRERKVLQRMLSDGITRSIVKPLTCVVYSPTEISRAFKLLSTKNQRGRVLVNMKHPEMLNGFNALPRISLCSVAVYIIVCDGSELGIGLLDHLVKQGARRFLIHMKPEQMSGYFHLKYVSWKNNGVNINFNADNLQTKMGCEIVLGQGTKLGHIDGIFITQNDITEHDIDYAMMTSSLDSVSRKLNTLRYFAVVTLTSSEFCNERAFADIEKCCFMRTEIGLPALVFRFEVKEKRISCKSLSKLFNSFESSLKQNYTSVLLSDSIESNEVNSEKESTENGFGAFFKQICKEECTATDPIIYMKTKMQNENESEIYLNPEEEHLMIIPGFDGNYQTMNHVSERLNILAATLQLEPDFDQSITEIANRLMNIIKVRIHLKSKFYILGYSFGVNVALELAALLEKEGKTGVVFCLDSSPDALKIQLNAYLGPMTDQELQNSLIEHIYNLLTGQTSTELTTKLEGVVDWSEKINLFIDIVKNSVTYTHEFLRSLVHVSYRRVVMAKEYEPRMKLESELVLMKGIPHPRAKKLSDDYGLSKYSTKPIKVFDLKADHVNTLQDCRISNIVNKMLEPGLLEEFKKKNLCKYYFA